MRDILLAIVVFGALPVALARPAFGLLVWSWLGYMNPHRLTYGFAYSFPWVMIVAIATILGAAFGREKLKFPWSAVTAVWLMLVLWLCVTTCFAQIPALAHAELERAIKIQIMILMTFLLINTRERITQLVWVMAMSIAFFGIKGGLFTVATAGSYRVWGPAGSFVEGNNEIALALLMVVPLMRFLQLQVERRWLRNCLTGAMVLCALSIVGSWSRGALVGGAAMVLFFWLKSRNKLKFGLPLILTALLAVAFMPQEWNERMSTIGTYQSDASAQGRINAWWFAFNLANDHPIVGGGFHVFDESLFKRYAPDPNDVHDAHSIYFEMLAEQGYVGLFLFLTLWWLTIRNASWVVRNARDDPKLRWAVDLVSMVQVGLIGYWTGGAFLGLAYFDLPYQMMSVIVLTRMLVARELAGRAAEATEVSPGSPRSRGTRGPAPTARAPVR
jgi:probable O-glycosylation ligase (exosortase A-associated)